MRIRGGGSPSVMTLEPYGPKQGYVELRLRENIEEVYEPDFFTHEEVKWFEYDEYTLLLKDREGLKEEIENNLDDWMATCRSLEG